MPKQPSTNTGASTSTKPAVTKYRPVLTSAHILHILALAKREYPHMSSASMNLIGVLAPFQAKIENAGIAAAYTTTPRVAINSLESLGVTPAITHTWATSTAIDSCGSKEQYWLHCYTKVQEAGTVACTLEEIQAANEHRYLNDMMTPEEEEQYELDTNPEGK